MAKSFPDRVRQALHENAGVPASVSKALNSVVWTDVYNNPKPEAVSVTVYGIERAVHIVQVQPDSVIVLSTGYLEKSIDNEGTVFYRKLTSAATRTRMHK